MWLLCALILVALGAVLMPVSITGGLIVWALAVPCFRRNTPLGEERLISWLMALAFLGAAGTTLHELACRFLF